MTCSKGRSQKLCWLSVIGRTRCHIIFNRCKLSRLWGSYYSYILIIALLYIGMWYDMTMFVSNYTIYGFPHISCIKINLVWGSAFPSQRRRLSGDGTPTEQIFSLSAGLVLEEFELTTNWVGPAQAVLLIKPVGWSTVEIVKVNLFLWASTTVANQHSWNWQVIDFNGCFRSRWLFVERVVWSHSNKVQGVNRNKSHRNPTGRCMMIIIEQTREFFGEQYVGIREIVSWS